MLKSLLLFIFLFLPFLGMAAPNSATPLVLVSIAPYKFFVERIAGDTVQVRTLVPTGRSSHTFEPTPKQAMDAGRADIWFRMGDSFEQQLIAALQSRNTKQVIVDLRDGVDLICVEPQDGKHHGCCCHADGADLHVWLSARMAKIQAGTIANALSQRYPQNANLYQKHLEDFLKQLDALDQELGKILTPMKGKAIMVSHPAYAYLCRDYGLNQLPIEFEGKDPSPRQLTWLLKQARQTNVEVVYTQPQHSDKGARLIAQELGAFIVVLDPYAENYFENMREIARNLVLE